MDQVTDCTQCEDKLFDFHEGNLDASTAAEVDAHLKTCDACAQLLNDIWQMNLVSTRWQDQQVPVLQANRGDYHFRKSGWQLPQLIATAASILALAVVLTDTMLDRASAPDVVTQAQLAEYRSTQDQRFNERFQRLTDQQVASNQLVLRTMLDTSRQERKEDLATLVTYWNTTQARQYQQTEEDLRYLLASQAEDEKDIQQLSDAFQRISLRRGNDM